MTFKWSAGCNCCESADVPCCVQAKRHFMDTLGFTQMRLSNGPNSGGSLSTYQGFCADTALMSSESLSFNLAGPYTENIIRNDDDCLFRRTKNQCPPAASYLGDVWNIGSTDSCSGLGSSSFLGIRASFPGSSCTQTNSGGGGPFAVDPVVTMYGVISFYCEGGAFKYRLELTTLWTYAVRGNYDFADDFPTTDGADYTTSGGFTYTRNDGNAFAGAGGGSYGTTTYAYNSTTSLTQWAPGIDFTGISETGLLELI